MDSCVFRFFTWWMHSLHSLSKTNMKLAIIFEIRRYSSKYLILGLVLSVEVSQDNSFSVIQRFEIPQIVEPFDRVFQLFFHKVHECVRRSPGSILSFGRLTIYDYLKSWIFGNVETRRHRALAITIYFGHYYPAGIGKQLPHLKSIKITISFVRWANQVSHALSAASSKIGCNILLNLHHSA